MRNYLIIYFLIALIFFSCKQEKKITNSEIRSPLFSQPKTFPLDLHQGYVINPWTNDSISPLINSLGKTIVTGQPVEVQADSVLIKDLPQPIKISPPKLQVSPTNTHIKKIPATKNAISINLKNLKKSSPTDSSASFVLKNEIGKIIPTGVPIPTVGQTIPYKRPTPSQASDFRFKNTATQNIQYIDVEQGMNASEIHCMLEDRNGNIWLGTHGSGVSKFNGENFIHITPKEGLPNKYVHAILEDRHGHIWLGTRGGLVRFDGRQFTYFTEKDGLANNYIQCMFEDKKGNLWIGTYRGGVSKYDGANFTNYTTKEGLPNLNVFSIIQDQNEDLWFGTLEGVCKFNGLTFSYLTKEDGLSDDIVQSMYCDSKGTIWIGTENGGLNKLSEKTITHFSTKEGLSNNFIRTIIEDSKGNLWLGTNGGGVNKFDGKEITHYTESNGLSSNLVESIIEDSSGNLWFGTESGGINKFNPNSFVNYTTKEGLSSNRVSYIIEEEHNGGIWMGNKSGRIDNLQTNKFVQLKLNHHEIRAIYQNNNFSNLELNHREIRSLEKDSKNNLWFGTLDNGLFKYDNSHISYYTKKEGLKSNGIRAILEDKKGNLWLGHNDFGGILKYDGKRFHYFTEEQGFSSKSVYSILEDRKGNLWFGTSNTGVVKYDGKYFTYYTTKEGLSHNKVYTIFEDRKGNIWIGTDGGGVNKFDGKNITAYREKEGLINDRIYTILEDRNGNIWVSTDKGLSCIVLEGFKYPTSFHKQGLDRKLVGSILNFATADGLKGLDFIANSSLLDKKNRAWWGSGKSLSMLDLKDFYMPSTTPKISLDRIEINGSFIDFHNLKKDTLGFSFQAAEPFNNYPNQLKLEYDQNHISFHFSAINWVAPHQIKYSYKIVGLNKNWSIPAREVKADYQNIPSGKHQFLVRAIGISGQWSEPFKYDFTILPPWWYTWWALLGYLLFAVFFIFIVVRWRTFQMHLRQKELEKEIRIATEDIIVEKKKSDELLLNILPAEVAQELKEKGKATARTFNRVTILFTDFKSFTKLSEQMSAEELVTEVNICFEAFDKIVEKYQIEKIKTIGDSYMAASNIPIPTIDAEKKMVLAALEMLDFIINRKKARDAKGLLGFEMRLGIHTGPVVAGIVGIKKFQYDLWGDTVNTASRMENQSDVGQVNISQRTYELLKDDSDFLFEKRGKIEVKGKGMMEMYFVRKS